LQGNNQVATFVVRSGFVGVTNVAGVVEASLAFGVNDTLARVDTLCGTFGNDAMPLAMLLGSQPDTSTAISFSYDSDTFGYVYDIQFSRTNQDDLVANTRITRFQCQNCDDQKNVTFIETRCSSNIVLKEAYFIFNVASQNVTVINNQSRDTTVSPTLFSGLVANYSKSLEGLQDIQGDLGEAYNTALVGDITSTFPTGLFNSSDANFLHSRLCGSVASSLLYLWNSYNISVVNGFQINGNDFNRYDVPKSLYTPVIRVYMSEISAWAVVCAFAVPTVVLSLLGVIYTYLAKINIKGSHENALLDNITSDDLNNRRRWLTFKEGKWWLPCKKSRVDRPAKASNDEDEQLELAFSTSMYCVEDDKPVHSSSSSTLGAGERMVRLQLRNIPDRFSGTAAVNVASLIEKDKDYC
jgi:hypothetical protein